MTKTTEWTPQEFREWLATQSTSTQFMYRDDPRLRQAQVAGPGPDRWMIDFVLDDLEKAKRAYDAIEKVLTEIGEADALRFRRINRIWVTK
jgi:hypothetical protein